MPAEVALLGARGFLQGWVGGEGRGEERGGEMERGEEGRERRGREGRGVEEEHVHHSKLDAYVHMHMCTQCKHMLDTHVHAAHALTSSTGSCWSRVSASCSSAWCGGQGKLKTTRQAETYPLPIPRGRPLPLLRGDTSPPPHEETTSTPDQSTC